MDLVISKALEKIKSVVNTTESRLMIHFEQIVKLWVALMLTDKQEFRMCALGFWPSSFDIPRVCLSLSKPEFAQT